MARRWHKLSDAVAVVADLKNSTKLGTGKWAASTASIYEASTGSVVKIFDEFDADFLAIQRDGAFALFWGERRYERALCAGITIKRFSRNMVERLEKRWPDLPETGFKVGVASSRLLAKRIGTPRNPAQQEPVWDELTTQVVGQTYTEPVRDLMKRGTAAQDLSPTQGDAGGHHRMAGQRRGRSAVQSNPLAR